MRERMADNQTELGIRHEKTFGEKVLQKVPKRFARLGAALGIAVSANLGAIKAAEGKSISTEANKAGVSTIVIPEIGQKVEQQENVHKVDVLTTFSLTQNEKDMIGSGTVTADPGSDLDKASKALSDEYKFPDGIVTTQVAYTQDKSKASVYLRFVKDQKVIGNNNAELDFTEGSVMYAGGHYMIQKEGLKVGPAIVNKDLHDFFGRVILEEGTLGVPDEGSIVMVAKDANTGEVKEFLTKDKAYTVGDPADIRSTPAPVKTEDAPLARMGVEAVSADTSKIWAESIIPNAEKLGESTGAGITFYLDESFNDPKMIKEMVPKKVEVKDENKLRIYREYMIWITLKNHGSDLAGNSFDEYLANRFAKQRKGEKMMWPLMAIDTKTLEPVTVDEPLGEIKFSGKLSDNTLKISEVEGGAKFDLLLATSSFYKLHPLPYVSSSSNLFEKVGIFVNSDDPARIMMVDAMPPNTVGSVGIWYNGGIIDYLFPNEVHAPFGYMSLRPSLNSDILSGKIGNLNAGGGKADIHSGLYEYAFWHLLQEGKIKSFADYKPTVSIS